MTKVLSVTLLIFYVQQISGQAEFELLSTSSKLCEYRIASQDSLNISYDGAKHECHQLNSSLAMIKNHTQQKLFNEKLVAKYGTGQNHLFFIGGELGDDDELKWLDYTLIPRTVDNNQYPRWRSDWTKPPASADKLVLTTFVPKGSNNDNNTLYFRIYKDWAKGYACERPVSGKPCDSSPCNNNGGCTDVGCSYSCRCKEGYRGRNCDSLSVHPCDSSPCKHNGKCTNDGNSYSCTCKRNYTGLNCELLLPYLVEAKPSSVIFNNTFALVCSVGGNPIPTVTWTITNTKLKQIDKTISSSSSSPFALETSVIGNATVAKLEMKAGGLCFGRSSISCWASSSETNRKKKIHEFKLNHLSYSSFGERYFIYSNDTVVSADEARNNCRNLGAGLADVPDKATQKFLMKAVTKQWNAKALTTKDAWIGLRKDDEGYWVWSNHQTVTYTNWADGEPQNLSCAHMTLSANNATWKAKTCKPPDHSNSFNARYICQKTGREVPIILNVTSSPCGSDKSSDLTIKWRPSQHMAKMNHTIDVTAIHVTTSRKIVHSGQSKTNKNGEYERTITNLLPRTKYKVKISVVNSFCLKPISSSRAHITGYAIPVKVIAAVISKPVKGNCFVTWTWPSKTKNNVEHFILKVSKYPNITRNESHHQIENLVKQENYILKISPQSRKASIPALPNRRHVIEVFAQSCAGNGAAFQGVGECIASVAGPSFLTPPLVERQLNSSFTISFASAYEDNGPISCYFLIARYTNASSNETQPPLPTQEFLDNLSSFIPMNVSYGIPYLALAVKQSMPRQMNRLFLGDRRKTSCDIIGKLYKTQQTSNGEREKIYQAWNHPLVPNKVYSFYIISSTPTFDGKVLLKASKITFFDTSFAVATSDTTVDMIILCVILPVAAVLSVIFALVMYRYNKSSQSQDSNTQELAASQISGDSSPSKFGENSGCPTYVNVDCKPPPIGDTVILLSSLKDTYHALMESNNKTLNNQFAAIKAATAKDEASNETGKLEQNTKFNRYKNIIPYDHSRVVLRVVNKSEEESMYINASYMTSYNCPKAFIATQGPLDRTIDHFWMMIWQENCRVIVMLARVFENYKKKCAQYWPDSESILETSDFTIKMSQEIEKGSYVVRKLEMKPKKEENVEPVIVTQYQFTEWPDHGVPMTTSGILRLHSNVLRTHSEDTSGPIVTHCSAGVGRTGTFIAIDHLLKEMEASSSIDVYTAVLNMRKDRTSMVQTINQYAFLHKALAELHLLGNTDYDANEFDAMCENIQSSSANEFNMLSLISPMKTSRSFGAKDENLDQNRTDENIPYDHSRFLFTTTNQNDKVTPYINASFVETYLCSVKLIAAQGPMPNTKENFWRTNIEYNVQVIVMLTPLKEHDQEMCCCYWPSGPVGSTTSVGKYTIELVEETENENYTLRAFEITSTAVTARVMQVHCENWSNIDEPPSCSDILLLINKVKTLSSNTLKGNILVHCSDGLKQTGVFCALFNLIERWNTEQKIDVFRAVKDLRDMRPNIVPTLGLYRLCYETMKMYLASFDPYGNFK